MASTMSKSARLSMPVAPPLRPVPEVESSVPRPICTDSEFSSLMLSPSALTFRSTILADGPVKVTVGEAVDRPAQVTPWGSGFSQVTL